MVKIDVGIIGLGLMGGSLGLALKNTSNNYHIVGLDHNPTHSKEALNLALVDEISTSIETIKKCKIIFLSVPVDAIITIIQNLAPLPSDTTLIDLGSTKEKISNTISPNIRYNFVASHPMTGTEKFGPTAAIEGLYQDKIVVLCDLEKSGHQQQETAKQLFLSIGMKIICMDAKKHDRDAAFISHMPHALSYALANAVLEQEESKSIIALAGGGFKDMSRIAKSSPHMWEDIFRQNKTNTLEAIDKLQKQLAKCQMMIEKNQWHELSEWMANANTLHAILD